MGPGAALAVVALLALGAASSSSSRPSGGAGPSPVRTRYGVRDEEKLSDEELHGIEALAAELGIEPRWLLAVMSFESRLEPAEVNPLSRATGLIQFMPSTARRYGTTVEDLGRMSRLEQLPWVKRFFAPWKGKLRSYLDTYLAVFYPAGVGEGKGDEHVLFRRGSIEYRDNAGMDATKDGAVTRGDVRRRISSVLRTVPPAPAVVAPGNTTLVLGDSLGFGIGQQLAAHHQAGIRVLEHASSGSMIRSVKATDPAIPGARVIVATATNDLATTRPLEQLAGELEQLVDELDKAAVVRVLVPLHPLAREPLRGRSAQFSALLEERGLLRPGVLVRDPTPERDRSSDGIHYTAAGYRRLADLLGAA